MTNESFLAPFTRVALFEGLSQARLESIARMSERIVYQAGNVIQSEGAPIHAAILVVSGKTVIVENRSDKEGTLVVPGSLVGELGMLIETRAVTTVVAQSSVRAFRILRSDLRLLMESDPVLADHFVAKITERLTHIAAEMRKVDGALEASMAKMPLPLPQGLRQAPPSHPIH